MTVNLRCIVNINAGTSGDPGVMTIYFRPGTVGGSVADATDCAARVRANLFSYANRFTNTVSMTVSGSMEAIEDTTGALTNVFSGVTPGLVIGTGAAPALPSASAALVQARTSTVVNGRFLRGRTFISGFNSAQLSPDGSLLAGASTALIAGFAGMIPPAATASFPVVWHRPGVTIGSSAPVVTYTTALQLAVLRSRRD